MRSLAPDARLGAARQGGTVPGPGGRPGMMGYTARPTAGHLTDQEADRGRGQHCHGHGVDKRRLVQPEV